MTSSHRVIPQILRRFVFEEWGGTESVVWHTTNKLNKKGIHAEIYSTKALALAHLDKEEVDNINIQRFDYYYPYWNLTSEIERVLDKKGGNPYIPMLYQHLMSLPQLDLIHCHGMQRIAGLVRKVAKKRGIPYVVSFHGGYLDVPQSEVNDMKASVNQCINYGKITDRLQGFHKAIQDANGIICVGYDEYIKVKENFPDTSVIYLPNGVNIEDFQYEGTLTFRSQFGIPNDAKLLLCVGRIDPQKNQKSLLEIHSTLMDLDLHLALVGPATNSNYLNEIKALIKEHNLENRVHLIGPLSPKDNLLAQAYQSADLLVLPSRHEPFGIVVLEAWAAELPVLVANQGGLKHLVDHRKTGLKFSSKAELKSLLEDFFSNPQIKLKLSKSGLKELKQKYTWDIITDQLLNFYEELLNT